MRLEAGEFKRSGIEPAGVERYVSVGERRDVIRPGTMNAAHARKHRALSWRQHDAQRRRGDLESGFAFLRSSASPREPVSLCNAEDER